MNGYAIAFLKKLLRSNDASVPIDALIAAETHRERVSFIRAVGFFGDQRPFREVECGEIRISRNLGVHHCEIDSRGPVQRLAVDLGAAGDEYFRLTRRQVDGPVQPRGDLYSFTPP